MARSLLRQYEQIRNSDDYLDVTNVNLASIAEPVVSGTLEDDLNSLRTLVKQVKGGSNWYDSLPTYTDPTNTGSDKDASLTNIAGNTLDSKTILIAVSDDASGVGYTVSGTSTGVLLSPLTTRYAESVNTTGLPIFVSTANTGSYADEGAADNICRIDIVNMDTAAEFETTGGHIVYGKFHDGADFSGSGDGSDVYVRLYANGSPIDMSSVSPTVTSIGFVYPQRKTLASMNEYDWTRTDFISSWEGDVELVEDVSNLWGYTGSANNIDSTAGTWDNTASYFLFQSNPSSLKAALDLINDGVGDRTYTESNYITSGSSITGALDALDQALQDVEDSVEEGVGEKYVEEVSSNISKNVEHTLPFSITYTPDATTNQEGKNMDIYVNGQLLAADTGTNGANADRDYGETSTTSVTFRFKVKSGSNITYFVRQ